MFFAPQMNQELIMVPRFQKNVVFLPQKWIRKRLRFLGPMGPWAHGPMGPWTHGPMGPRSRTTKPITFFPKLSIDEAHNILSKIIHSFDIFPYIPICPWLHFLYIPICPGLNPLYIPYMSMVIPSLLSTLCGLLGISVYPLTPIPYGDSLDVCGMQRYR